MKYIDAFLNKTTMYRVVLYYVTLLAFLALVLSVFGVLPYSAPLMLLSLVFITFVCFLTNLVFSKVFRVPANIESVYITAYILFLIITPPAFFADASFYVLAFWASVWAMASKYILVIGKKHVFNPAAIGVAICAVVLGLSASWWVGTTVMVPLVLLGGLAVVRKVIRFPMIWSFILASLVSVFATHLAGLTDLATTTDLLWKVLAYSPVLFFAFAMLSEPLTTPPAKGRQILYGAFVGLLFSPAVHVGPVYSTPELALLVGNILSFFLTQNIRSVMTLKEKKEVAPATFDFAFTPDKKFSFRPGQYIEWTLGHANPDSRGNRRYFTIASSPTESEIHLGIKFYEPASTFKTALKNMAVGDSIVATQVGGDFVLPTDTTKKLVFIAGGIGVTPFRSMVKYMVDKGEKRDVVLLYSNRTPADIAYKDLFDEAREKIGLKVVHAVGQLGPNDRPEDYIVGFIDKKVILVHVPDYADRYFYISGPHTMVSAFEGTLSELGLPASHIKTDFFPGFA